MRLLGGAIAAAALLGSPLAAQEEAQFAPAFSPEEDLDCAIYIAALMSETQVEMTPESRVGLTSALTYFIGRYEIQRGQDLARAMADRFPAYQERNPQEVEQICSIRARGLGSRMQAAGRAMAQSQTPAEQAPEQ